MTETEIVQFLEEMSADFPNGYARGCIDLINRKNAKIERLNFENLQMIASIKNLKAEAIKEVFAKVKGSSNKMDLICSGALVRREYTITKESLDQIAKEMGVEL